jgi:hypothetical protein
MILEARSADCCSTEFVLKVDGRPVGKYEGRWFSEGLDVQLLGRHTLRFEQDGWFTSRFVLKFGEEQEKLVEADRAGVFTSAWDLKLSVGPAQMVLDGWFTTAYVLTQGDRRIGSVDRAGVCERGWTAEGTLPELMVEDLLVAGLVYHIVQMRAQRHAAHGGHAGT